MAAPGAASRPAGAVQGTFRSLRTAGAAHPRQRRGHLPPPGSAWHPLTSPLLWEGDQEAALRQPGAAAALTPPWKLLLLSDGSVTRHLQLLTGLAVEVDCLEMAAVDSSSSPDSHGSRGGGDSTCGGGPPLPAAAALIAGPLVQRQVLLRLPAPVEGAYVYAASWWAADTVDQYLRDRSAPIWASLSAERRELYRDVLQVHHGSSPFLEQHFGAAGPFWGRTYVFWHQGRPLTAIYEVFSPRLQQFLA